MSLLEHGVGTSSVPPAGWRGYVIIVEWLKQSKYLNLATSGVTLVSLEQNLDKQFSNTFSLEPHPNYNTCRVISY